MNNNNLLRFSYYIWVGFFSGIAIGKLTYPNKQIKKY